MKNLLFLVLFFLFTACAHHHNKTEHHHHQFNKKCAYEVSQNHFDVAGKEEFKLDHEGDTYYFSSEENKVRFEKDLASNIKRSKENWKKGPPSSRKN